MAVTVGLPLDGGAIRIWHTSWTNIEKRREIQRRAEESKIQLVNDPALKAAIGKELIARQEGFVEAILELCQRSEPEYMATAERLYCALRRKFGETYYGQRVRILHEAPPPASAVAVDA